MTRPTRPKRPKRPKTLKPPKKQRTFALALLSAFALLIAACGANEIDSEMLLEQIDASVIPEHPGLLQDLDCPGPIEVGAGIDAECTGTIDGESVTIDVAQIDEEGGIEVELREPLFDVVAAADKLGERFEFELGVPTSVECGEPPLRVLEVGMVIDCLADDGSTNRSVALTVLDETGAYELTLG